MDPSRRTASWRRFPGRSATTEGTAPATPSVVVTSALDAPGAGQVEITYTNNDDSPVVFYRDIGGRTGTRTVAAGETVVQAYVHDSATEDFEIRATDAAGEVVESYTHP